MKNIIGTHKWFWAWQDEKEEQWLSEMSNQGYHLISPGSFGRYEFEQGEPKNYVYRLDFLAGKKDQMEAYLQFFADAGWDYLGQFGGWQYFRILTEENQNPEIYTDASSKIAKYQRVLGFLVILFPIYLMPIYFRILVAEDSHWLMVGVSALWVFLLLLFGFSGIMIFKRIKKLKQTIKQ